MAEGFTVEFDTREAERMLSSLLDRVNRPKRLMQAMSRYVNSVTFQMFSGRRADTSGKRGVKWPPLSQETIMAKRAALARGAAIEEDRPLVRTGKMRDSLKVLERADKGFVYGTRLRSKKGFSYPAIHNTGGSGSKPPQRPWLFLTPHDFAQMAKMTKDYLENRLQGFTSYVGKG